MEKKVKKCNLKSVTVKKIPDTVVKHYCVWYLFNCNSLYFGVGPYKPPTVSSSQQRLDQSYQRIQIFESYYVHTLNFEMQQVVCFELSIIFYAKIAIF